MKQESVFQRNPLLRWLFQAQRIPLLFSVTVVSGIFYHYAPNLTWLWILLSLVLQTGLFRLFDFVKKHNLLGGILYVIAGLASLYIAGIFIRLGRATPFWAPQDLNQQLSFMIWFLTPQSVLVTSYLGYTVGLFVLFTMFISTAAYYFSLVRYRVLMSFVVMIFPFAIYAKENETMPVLSIIILLVCYFAVMIYCRQAHGEDSDVVQKYVPDADSSLSMPSKKSPHAKVKPEMLDGAFLHAVGVFLAAATILILVIPKPKVQADRAVLDMMLDFSSLSDYLMNAISGFTDSSDGGSYNNLTYSRALYYAKAREPLNLKSRTFTNYDYEADEWNASDYDGMPSQLSTQYVQMDGFLTVAETADPAAVVAAVQQIAAENPEFAEEWGLQALAALPAEDASKYYFPLEVESASYSYFVHPAPLHVREAVIKDRSGVRINSYQNQSGVMFNYQQRAYRESYALTYLSEAYSHADAAQMLMLSCDSERWSSLLLDAYSYAPWDGSGLVDVLLDAYIACSDAKSYSFSVESQTPETVRALAQSLTEGLYSDYEKANAIREYLRNSGEFVYSLDFPITDADNVETFLFQNKTGVCYQFASAMAELCRAAGLYTRYVEGYSMSEPDTRLLGGSDWDYVITTDHGHAFVDVFIAGYGWMMFDATAPSLESSSRGISVIATLQYSGLILFGAASVVVVLLVWVIPMLREAYFRKWYQKHRDAEGVQRAMLRLRRQWQADPSVTARVLCEEKSAFLQVDMSPLLEGFEQAVYANRCDPETAEQVFRVYCAAYDAWKPALKRRRKAEKAARKKGVAAQ